MQRKKSKMMTRIAVLMIFMMLTSVTFADVVIFTGAFSLEDVGVSEISIDQGDCVDVKVTLAGEGSIEGFKETDWVTHPIKVIVYPDGTFEVEGTTTTYFEKNQTELFFYMEFCAADEEGPWASSTFDIFQKAPRMGPGGGVGDYISFGTGVKIHKKADAMIHINGGGNGAQYVDLEVSKSADVETAEVGEEITFTITVTNNGPSIATGVKITDEIPEGLEFLSVSGDGTYDETTGIWDVGTLNVEESATIEVVTKVLVAAADSTVTNIATVYSLEQMENDTENDSDSVSVVIGPYESEGKKSDLEMDKTANLANTTIGNQVSFTVTVTNNGPDAATNVVVEDILPAGVSFVNATGDGSYDAVSGLWTVGSLDAEESASITIVVQVLPGAAGTTVTNTASVSELDEEDPNVTNNSSSVSVVIAAVVIPPGDNGGGDNGGGDDTTPITEDTGTTETIIEETLEVTEEPAPGSIMVEEVIVIEEEPAPALPNTGGNNVLARILGLAILAIGVTLYYLERKKVLV